jgi:vacuolar-type H+-ATPase catalytic subunit A/Vma1
MVILDLSKLRFADNFRFIKWLYSYLSPLNVVNKHYDATVQRILTMRKRFAQKPFLREIENKNLKQLCEKIGKKNWNDTLSLIEENLDELFEEHFILPQIRSYGIRKHCLINKCK